MEKRFGIKDLVLLLMLGALILVVLLAMKQYDRQWEVLSAIQKQSAEQTTELSRIRRTLASGISVRGGTGGGVPTTGPASTNPIAANVTSPGALPGVTDPFFR